MNEATPAAAPSPLPTVLLILTFTTGLVDAVSWVALGHVFTALMTGNIVFLAFAAAGVEGLSLLRSIVALAAFMVGAAVGGRLHRAMRATRQSQWLLRAGLVESTFLACAVGFALVDPPAPSSTGPGMLGIISATALAMGFRSATVLRLKDPDLKTTVMTLTLTGIAADSWLAGGASPRIGRRLAAVLSLLAGAFCGVVLLHHLGPAVPLLATLVLVLGASLYYVARDTGTATQPEPRPRN